MAGHPKHPRATNPRRSCLAAATPSHPSVAVRPACSGAARRPRLSAGEAMPDGAERRNDGGSGENQRHFGA